MKQLSTDSEGESDHAQSVNECSAPPVPPRLASRGETTPAECIVPLTQPEVLGSLQHKKIFIKNLIRCYKTC